MVSIVKIELIKTSCTLEIIMLMSCRDHISFINEMKVLIQSDELAKDVASAESLLERHQEHKVSNEPCH